MVTSGPAPGVTPDYGALTAKHNVKNNHRPQLDLHGQHDTSGRPGPTRHGRLTRPTVTARTAPVTALIRDESDFNFLFFAVIIMTFRLFLERSNFVLLVYR